MVLKLYPIRLDELTITELVRRADGNPVAPFIRNIIDGWLGLDDTLQKEHVLKEIEGLTGQINLLNQQLKIIEESEQKQIICANTDTERKEYLQTNIDILKMYRDKSISPKGYQLLQDNLGFKNKEEVVRWLEEQYQLNIEVN